MVYFIEIIRMLHIFVESISLQICDTLAKTNTEEEEKQAVRDLINDSFEDVMVDKIPDIPYQINNSRRIRITDNYAEKTYHLSKESKRKNKKTLFDESLKEFNNLKKEFERENIVSIPIEQDNTIPIDIEKVITSTDMSIHSDNNNLNNGGFHLYCDVSDNALSSTLYQIQGDKFKVIWFLSRKLTDTQKRYSIGDIEFLSIID
ncbi:hypothetical protein ACTFIW_008796 [Dictyostelium discoideum]